MATESLMLTIPIKIERALEHYAQGGISFGAAAQLAGVSQSELARQAYARGMEPPFNATTLVEELNIPLPIARTDGNPNKFGTPESSTC